MLLISSKIFIFRKVTVDLVTLMEKTHAILEVSAILGFCILLRLSLCKCRHPRKLPCTEAVRLHIWHTWGDGRDSQEKKRWR